MGCGSGLPSISILYKNPNNQIHFLDFNEQVLKLFTIPNLVLNLKNNKNDEFLQDLDYNIINKNQYRFFFGDFFNLVNNLIKN